MKAMINDKKTKADLYLDPKTKKFKKNNPGGPGYPTGQLNFSTKWFKFLNWIAKQEKVKPEDIDNELFKVILKKMRTGNFPFIKDTNDRIYGQAKQSMDLTSDGEPLGIIILPNKNAENSEKH